MIVIRDDEMKRGYQLIGNVLFCAFIFKDGSIDTDSWHPIKNLTLYHQDMIEKLRILTRTAQGLKGTLADDGL